MCLFIAKQGKNTLLSKNLTTAFWYAKVCRTDVRLRRQILGNQDKFEVNVTGQSPARQSQLSLFYIKSNPITWWSLLMFKSDLLSTLVHDLEIVCSSKIPMAWILIVGLVANIGNLTL